MLGSFDPTRQLCREDVCLLVDSVKVHLKWAKNLQKSDHSHDVYLPKMSDPYLCPHRCLSLLFQCQNYAPTDPVVKINHMYVIEVF